MGLSLSQLTDQASVPHCDRQLHHDDIPGYSLLHLELGECYNYWGLSSTRRLSMPSGVRVSIGHLPGWPRAIDRCLEFPLKTPAILMCIPSILAVEAKNISGHRVSYI